MDLPGLGQRGGKQGTGLAERVHLVDKGASHKQTSAWAGNHLVISKPR